MVRIALGVVALAAAFASQAQTMYRCPDANGQINFTDKPCTGGTKINVQPNMLPSEGARRDVELYRQQEHAQRLAATAPPCRFSSYAIGGSTGKALAAAARKECLDNHMTGQNNRIAYETWRDHQQNETARRGNIINAAPKQVIILNRP